MEKSFLTKLVVVLLLLCAVTFAFDGKICGYNIKYTTVGERYEIEQYAGILTEEQLKKFTIATFNDDCEFWKNLVRQHFNIAFAVSEVRPTNTSNNTTTVYHNNNLELDREKQILHRKEVESMTKNMNCLWGTTTMFGIGSFFGYLVPAITADINEDPNFTMGFVLDIFHTAFLIPSIVMSAKVANAHNEYERKYGQPITAPIK